MLSDAAGESTGLLEKKSLRDEVFELLYRRIVSGEYSLGEWLRQEEIANELGVSPTPVREALDQLVAEGLAERIPYRGVRVPQLAEEEIADAYALRFLLEVAAVRLSTYNISQKQADSLQAVLVKTERLLESDDVSAYQHLNRQLHRGIAAASGNRLLIRLYELVINRFPDWMMYGGLIEQPELRRSALQRDFEEHQVLVELITSREADAASRQAVKHMRGVAEELVAWAGVSEDLLREKEREIRALLPGYDEK
ncbi:MAG: GntR family transcriptional regulator [Anaerolineae bacterium]|jgi:DNA-binding GntR family transcriptional regulator